MNKLKVGVVILEDLMPTEGGAYSYQHTLLEAINSHNFDPAIDIYNVCLYTKGKPTSEILSKPTVYIKLGFGAQLRQTANTSTKKLLNTKLTRRNPIINLLSSFVLRLRNKKVERVLREHKIDVLYYLKPEWEVLDYPFIATHWDVGHRSLPPFPEVASDGMYEKREKYYNYTLNKALLILCESDAGKKELLSFYSYRQDKVKVMPMFPGSIIKLQLPERKPEDVLLKFNLQKQEFFLYPAQFWAHKNHYNLLLAFNQIISLRQSKVLKLVLVGSDKGNMNYIKEVVALLNLTEYVAFTGFVTNEELYCLYKSAIALVMPTFLGPTNMPVLEAAYLNCPVICSNLAGHREQLGEHAVYFDPSNANSIADALIEVGDPELREVMSKDAMQFIENSKFNLSNSLKELNTILLELMPIRKAWDII